MTAVALAASLLLATSAASAAAANPPVSVKLSENTYSPGDDARVHVKAAESGYLLVLQMDAERHIRVLYPLNPNDPTTVKGGHDIEVRGRGNRDAFTVSGPEGSGLVLAARTDQPPDFAGFTRGNRWDLASLASSDTANVAPEAALLDLVDRMTDGHYDYDVETYTVGPKAVYQPYPDFGFGPWYPGFYPWPYAGFGMRIGLGWRHRW